MKLAFAVQFLSVVVLTTTPPALAGQWTWKELYDGGNYIEAADGLKAELEKGKNNAANNYYYADCLLRLDKVDKALPYYMKVYKMAPQTQFGKFSKQVLLRYNRLASKNVTVGSTSATRAKQLGISTPWDAPDTMKNDNPVQTPKAAPAPVAQNDELMRELQKKLPKLVRTARPHPTQGEMGGWTLSSLAGYCPTASSRVNEAETQLEEAKQVLHQATTRITGSGSPFRKFGESDEETKSRINATNDAVDKALAPYQENVAELTSRLSEQQAILQMCVNARNTLYSTPVVPIYRGW